MRDLRTRLTRSRRVALGLLILASYPVMAEQPRGHLLQMMPPLPLQSISSGQIRSNPFCESESMVDGETIQLASGHDSIRLKPIQGEIGFHTIQDNAINDASPVITVAPTAAPEVQNNPLIKSVHHKNSDLVETEVDGPLNRHADSAAVIVRAPSSKVPGGGAEPQNSSIILIPPVKTCIESASPLLEEQEARILLPSPVIRSTSTPAEPVDSSIHITLTEELLAQDIPTEAILAQDAGIQEAPTQEVLTNEARSASTEPVTFSLSDVPAISDVASPADDVAFSDVAELTDIPAELEDNPPSTAVDTSQVELTELPFDSNLPGIPQPVDIDDLNSNALQPLALENEYVEFSELEDSETAELESSYEPAQPMDRVQENPVLPSPPVEETIEVAVAAPIQFGASDLKSPPASRPAVTPSAPIAIQRAKPGVIVADQSANQSLHRQRYRPPVAVTPMPSAYTRGEAQIDASRAETTATVQPVAEMDLTAPKRPALASHIKLTPLYMKSAQVRSLTVAGELRDVQIADKSVCQAVAAGPNQVKLIGTGDGVTQLVVWAQTDDPNKPMRMRAFEIHVDRVDPAVQAGGRTANLLNQSIRNAFPQCNVVLSQEGGELVVSGRCDSDESAEKIIRMIRKTCLVPVQDRLSIR